MGAGKTNKDYRTLKLTHEQIELIIQALGMAENKFTEIHKDIISNSIKLNRNKF